MILDRVTLRSTPESGSRAGYDGARRQKGSRIHIAADTTGHLLAAHVTSASEQDRAQGACSPRPCRRPPARAWTSPSWNLIAIAAQAGVHAVCRAVFLRQDRFDFSDEGVPSAIIEVLDGDAETVLDLIAWPLHEPATFASTLGQAEEPGLWQFRKPASCGGSRLLHVWRTPLS